MADQKDRDKGKRDPVLLDDSELQSINHVEDLYKDWFLEYASYVILDRAVPNLDDGLKPVQRRILHSLNELEDGRYNKAANVIGHTMRYHPHGDAAIGEAMVKMAQKELLIDTQGNWGNPITGDRAAAPRYIEARLSEFAKTVVFNPKTTEWIPSYDGRNKEPIALPTKFPLLLNMGTEGIAVGLSTKILPHNFCELIKASIKHLQGKSVKIEPDFSTGGVADFSDYRDGKKGGKVKIRAVIEKSGAKTLKIKEVPFGITTSSLIDSILSAHDKGKIKIKKVEDNTAQEVEVLIELPGGVSPDLTIDALFAFTDCEVSISPNCCIIQDDKPRFVGVSEILRTSTDQTKGLLEAELRIKELELKEKLHFASLEQVFIDNKIYRKIESASTWEAVIATIEKGLKPFAKSFFREVTEEDIVRLTEIKIKRISKFDTKRAEEAITKLKDSLAEVQYDLKHLVEFCIEYFQGLLEKFGKTRGRRTKKSTFSEIKAATVAHANQKVYVDYKGGFVGTSLKKFDYLGEFSEFDEIVGFSKSGIFCVKKIAAKAFFDKDLIHVSHFRRNDERMVYHIIYREGKKGSVYAKRFISGGVTREKEYDLIKSETGSKLLYFTANPNGESEVVKLELKSKTKRKKTVEVDFGELEIKTRAHRGIMVTKETVGSVTQTQQGGSTLEGQNLWFDKEQGRLNNEERGEFLGEFDGDEYLLAIHSNGTYELMPIDFEHYLGQKVALLETYVDQVISVVYYEGERKACYVKRFELNPETVGKRQEFIPQTKGTKILLITTQDSPLLKVTFKKGKKGTPSPELVRLADIIDIKGVKALGNKLSKHDVKSVDLISKKK